MTDWLELDRALGAIASSGTAEVREDGEWLAELAGLRYELRHEGKTPLVHLWSDERNLTRRVLGVREQSQDRIVLEVKRFGRTKPGRLEFLRADSARLPGRVTREQFRARFQRFLAERFPDATVDLLSASPDLEHSFSGLYVRGRMKEGARIWAIMAASSGENAATVEGIITFAILWLDWARGRSARHAIEGLRLFVPVGASHLLAERVLALSSSARTEIFEFDESSGAMHKMDPAEAGNVQSRLVPRRDVELMLSGARDAATRVPALKALLGECKGSIRANLLPSFREVVFCFYGLAFASWSSEAGIQFGLGDRVQRLTGANEKSLERLVRQLVSHRSPLASDKKSSLYRNAPERWLETVVLKDPERLDAQLDHRHIYSQVPALLAGSRGVLDLLGVTRRGRLVVMELKVSEDIHLPMQAVDYWLRVRRHQLMGDLQRSGYFVGVELDPKPPLVWLVVPGLHFHPATDTVLRYLSPEIQLTRIGLTENWRRGLKVVFRQ